MQRIISQMFIVFLLFFDSLATESEFVRRNLLAFMNGTINSVVMTDCNHAKKNLRSQLVPVDTLSLEMEFSFKNDLKRKNIY